MQSSSRRMHILELLDQRESVEVMDLSRRFAVSPMTIRRDLALFERQGLVTLVYGGAVVNRGATFEPEYALRTTRHNDQKRVIGVIAASLIDDGDVVFLDAGTTTLEIALALRGRANLTVVTPDLAITNLLCREPKMHLIMVGGSFREVSMAFMGPLAERFMGMLQADKAFLGVDGIDLEVGFTVPDLRDASLKMVVTSRTPHVYIVGDTSKFGKRYLATFATFQQVEGLVMGIDRSDEYVKNLEAAGLRVVCRAERAA